MGNSRTGQRGELLSLLWDNAWLIQVFIFHKVAWPCPPALTGMNSHLRPKLPASTLKSFKLNMKGQLAFGAGPKITLLALERGTLKASPAHMPENLQK